MLFRSPDITPPTIRITSPVNGATVSGAAVPISASSDNIAEVTKVDFLVDGVLLTSDTTAPFETVLDTTTYTNGSHILSVKAYDAAGNVGTSTSVTITISNSTTPPPVTKKCDFNNDTFVDSNDLFILLANFNKTVPPGTRGDCNSSGMVDNNDLFILLAGYGK